MVARLHYFGIGEAQTSWWKGMPEERCSAHGRGGRRITEEGARGKKYASRALPSWRTYYNQAPAPTVSTASQQSIQLFLG